MRFEKRVIPLLRLVQSSSLKRYQSTSIRDIQQKLDSFQIDQNELKKDLESKTLLQDLTTRGLISQCSSIDELESLLLKDVKLGIYSGADPSAKSLHLGNLLPLILLLHFNLRGHNIIGLVGGATGEVGDPSGRTTERDVIKDEIRLDNVKRISNQMEGFLNNGVRYVKSISINKIISNGSRETVNNLSWWENVSLLKFLAQFGKHIRISSMLARDSIKDRLSSEQGLGFNEFTYQILQAYDFYHLFKNKNISIQIGGNDQWGNITAGTDLINRLKSQDKNLKSKTSFALTVPLLTTSSGEKFGKSAGNAIFIDNSITPSFEIYQYFIKANDDEVEKLLKIFTFIPSSQIDEIMEVHLNDPSFRYAQRILANEITDLIHGLGSGKVAKIITSILHPFPDQPYPDISTQDLISSFKSANILKTLSKDQFLDNPFSTIVSELQKCSKNEAKKLIKQGGVYQGFNRIRVDESDDLLLTNEILIDNKLLLLRVGKSKYHVVELV
ncbi:hypothetical protein WICMUC_000931 [Wickerhamomyces mucosus]|uniref:Tyrosine--tRNA ligase n=1 Tax=Wickerhamomyces mucosus TaxID=1378264 RepID=A0A9P8THY3_9ASCO|nr:hypothetical protein WICMUC_000931 [Wickerhamomyces mucosus]